MPITVSGLFTYAVKSGRGVAHEKIDVTQRGLAADRLWMVVDENNRFITQRDRGCEKLAVMRGVTLLNGDLDLHAPGFTPLVVTNPNKTQNDRRLVTVQKDTAYGFDAGEEAAAWVSAYLGRAARLVRIDDSYVRQSNQTYAGPGDQTGFADGYAVLITNEASLDALNVPVGMDRFRPNIVLKGLKPFEEDAIATLQIGSAVFNVLKPCDRCSIPGIDQTRGEMDKVNTPLPALAKLRRGKADGLQGVFFGQNAAPSICGTISVGDPVTIIARKAPHPALDNAALRYTA